MEKDRGFNDNFNLIAYIDSPFKVHLMIAASAKLLEWGIPAAFDAGVRLDDKVAELVK